MACDGQVHLVNLGQVHWQAFVPAAAVPFDTRSGTYIAGEAQEAGGAGDCLYYAFLASLDAQTQQPHRHLDPSAQHARMLTLRQDLGDYFADHWHTPMRQLGGHADDTSTLGQTMAAFYAAANDVLTP